MTTETPSPRPGSGSARGAFRTGLLSVPPLVTAAIGLALVLIAALVTGEAGAAGASIGWVLATSALLVGTVTVHGVTRAAPAASLLVALLTYVLTVLGLALVFVALTRSGVIGDTVDAGWLGGTVIACTVVWVTVAVALALRLRQPIYDLPSAPSGASVADEEANVR